MTGVQTCALPICNFGKDPKNRLKPQGPGLGVKRGPPSHLRILEPSQAGGREKPSQRTPECIGAKRKLPPQVQGASRPLPTPPSVRPQQSRADTTSQHWIRTALTLGPHLAGDRGHTRYALCQRLSTRAILLPGAFGRVWRQFWSSQLGGEGGGRAPGARRPGMLLNILQGTDRKSTRLNSSH